MTVGEPTVHPSFRFARFDVRTLLPRGWQTQIESIAQSGNPVDVEGLDLGTCAPDRRPLRYLVTDGRTVAERRPWLDSLYRGRFKQLAESAFGTHLDCSIDLARAVNLNYLRGPRDSYEWHLDTNPITGLLFVNGLESEDGGGLVFESEELGVAVRVRPVSGVLLVFDARRLPHAIDQLAAARRRVSVPMNYFFAGSHQRTDKDLFRHVYGAEVV